MIDETRNFVCLTRNNREQHRIVCTRAFYPPPPVQDRPIFILYPPGIISVSNFHGKREREREGGFPGLTMSGSAMCLGNLTFACGEICFSNGILDAEESLEEEIGLEI